MKDKFREMFKKLRETVIPVSFCAVLVGVFVACVVFLYRQLLEHAGDWSANIYAYVAGHLAFLPLLIIGAGAIGLFLGYTVKLIPEILGGGIPYIEGVARGKLSLRWFLALPAMFIASIISVFGGLSVGGEGPSVFMGGSVGYGTAKVFRAHDLDRCVLTSAGGSSGFAAAFGAPFAGILFSVEDAHRKVTPQILLPAIVSVAVTTIMCRLVFQLGPILDFSGADFGRNNFNVVGALVAGVVCGLLGSLFNLACTAKSATIEKVKTQFRPLIAIGLAVVLGLVLPLAIGSGSAVLGDLEGVYASGAGLVAVIFLAKFLLTSVSSRSGASGGLMLPMLTLGALAGMLTASILHAWGLPVDTVFVCLMGASAFFSASVKAPLTGIVLMLELTWFEPSSMLGAVLAVGVAFLVSEFIKTAPLYDALLVDIRERQEEGADKTDNVA